LKGTALTLYSMKNEEISNGIYTALKPLYFVCKVLGLVTYSFVQHKNNNKVATDFRPVNVVYSMVWIVFCVIAFTYTVCCIHNCDPQLLSSKMRTAFYIYYTILYVTCSAIFVNSILVRRKCPLILKKLSLVDSLLFKQHEAESVNSKSMLAAVAEIVIVFVVSFLLNFFYIYSNREDICFTTCLTTMECVTMYINMMMVLLYCKLVRMTNDRYKHVNKRLSSCISHACTNNSVEYDNIFHARSTFVRQENILTLRVSPIYFKSFNGSQFRSLRNILSEINCVISLINETYGISVLAFTCWLLVSVIIVLFSILYELEDHQYGSIGSMIVFFILLIRISSTCHTVESENDTSKLLVQKLLLEDDLKPQDITELKFLSFQLNSTTVQYSAYGLFVLNLSFLCSITGVIISYMIIVVQLK
jgi:hypothetical protein